MNISEQPISKIKRFFVYSKIGTNIGVLDLIKSNYVNGVTVIRRRLFLQSDLTWSEKPFGFDTEELAMEAIRNVEKDTNES